MSDFLTSKTAIYGSSGSGKSTMAYAMIEKHKPPRTVVIDPEAADGRHTVRDVNEALRQIADGAPMVIFNGQRRDDKLAVLLFACGRSTKAKPIYCVCDEAPGYLDKMTDALGTVFFRGRHRGFGMMILAQRPSAIDANFRTQCAETYWMRMVDHCDLNVAAQQIGREASANLPTFTPGEFHKHPPAQEPAA
jgi:DNA helicase HerA-like ATPase